MYINNYLIYKMDRIRNYYKLNAIKSADNYDKSLLDYLSERMVKVIFSKSQTEKFMKSHNDHLEIKETVIGAGDYEVESIIPKFTKKGGKILII